MSLDRCFVSSLSIRESESEWKRVSSCQLNGEGKNEVQNLTVPCRTVFLPPPMDLGDFVVKHEFKTVHGDAWIALSPSLSSPFSCFGQEFVPGSNATKWRFSH